MILAPTRSCLRLGSFIVGVILAGGVANPPRLHAEVTPVVRKEVHRIVFLGNSITRHPPLPRIDWAGDWGMAASAEQKDFVHLVAKALADPAGTAPEILVRNIAAYERAYATFDPGETLKEAAGFKPDLVIVAIGENVPALASPEAEADFKRSVSGLLQGLTVRNHPAIVVRSCFWPDPTKDRILHEACQAVGGTFVDIGSLGRDESNYARSERIFKDQGVAKHPGDKGMQAIADAIVAAINGR